MNEKAHQYLLPLVSDGIVFTTDSAGLLIGGVFIGGEGIDTLQLIGGGAFALESATISSVEIVRGSEANDTFLCEMKNFPQFQTIDGGDGVDRLVLGGSKPFNLVGKTITGFEEISLESYDGAKVTISDKNIAFLMKGLDPLAQPEARDQLTLQGGIFTAEERQRLHDRGIDIIIDESGTYEDLAPQIENFAGALRISTGETVFLDTDQDALVTDEGEALVAMQISYAGAFGFDGHDHLDIDTTGNIGLSNGLTVGSEISVGTVVVGVVSESSTAGFKIAFNDEARPDRVQDILRALTYSRPSSDTPFMDYRAIEVMIWDKGLRPSFDIVSLAIGPRDVKMLSLGQDALTGTSGDDTFAAIDFALSIEDEIDGGDGTDTLLLLRGGQFAFTNLAKLEDIEIIRGSDDAEDTFIFNADQLNDILEIDGGKGQEGYYEDIIELSEDGDFDLSGKVISDIERIELTGTKVSITVGDKNVAFKIQGKVDTAEKGNEHVILRNGVFTAEERRMLHRQGINQITDDSGSYINRPASLAGIDGDRVVVRSGVTTSIDVGRNVVLSDDSAIGKLSVEIQGDHDETDVFGIDTSGSVQLSNGVTFHSKVSVGGVVIGFIYTPNPSSLGFEFNEDATPERVQELLRALTYTSQKSGPIDSRQLNIQILDEGQRLTKASVTLESAKGPQDIDLSGVTVQELAAGGTVIGTLSASDPNEGDTLTFSLTENPGELFEIRDRKLVVKDGLKLDFEQAQSHQITIQVRDSGGLTYDEVFTIAVGDVNPERTDGSMSDDVFVGGAGNDTLGGGAGHDRIVGGPGNDRLNGGQGNDVLSGGMGKDIFIFDTQLGTENFDKITNFATSLDKIWLDNAIFKQLGSGTVSAPGRLNEAFFIIGNKAKDENDYLIYNKETGVLSYDVDGSGSKLAVEFAKLGKKLELTSAHFFVV